MSTEPAPGGSGEGTVADGFLTADSVTIAAVTGEFLATRGSLQTRRAYGAAVQGFSGRRGSRCSPNSIRRCGPRRR